MRGVGIFDDESDYGDFDDNECIFLAIKEEFGFTNLESCVKERRIRSKVLWYLLFMSKKIRIIGLLRVVILII